MAPHVSMITKAVLRAPVKMVIREIIVKHVKYLLRFLFFSIQKVKITKNKKHCHAFCLSHVSIMAHAQITTRADIRVHAKRDTKE